MPCLLVLGLLVGATTAQERRREYPGITSSRRRLNVVSEVDGILRSEVSADGAAIDDVHSDSYSDSYSDGLGWAALLPRAAQTAAQTLPVEINAHGAVLRAVKADQVMEESYDYDGYGSDYYDSAELGEASQPIANISTFENVYCQKVKEQHWCLCPSPEQSAEINKRCKAKMEAEMKGNGTAGPASFAHVKGTVAYHYYGDSDALGAAADNYDYGYAGGDYDSDELGAAADTYEYEYGYAEGDYYNAELGAPMGTTTMSPTEVMKPGMSYGPGGPTPACLEAPMCPAAKDAQIKKDGKPCMPCEEIRYEASKFIIESFSEIVAS